MLKFDLFDRKNDSSEDEDEEDDDEPGTTAENEDLENMNEEERRAITYQVTLNSLTIHQQDLMYKPFHIDTKKKLNSQKKLQILP